MTFLGTGSNNQDYPLQNWLLLFSLWNSPWMLFLPAVEVVDFPVVSSTSGTFCLFLHNKHKEHFFTTQKCLHNKHKEHFSRYKINFLKRKKTVGSVKRNMSHYRCQTNVHSLESALFTNSNKVNISPLRHIYFGRHKKHYQWQQNDKSFPLHKNTKKSVHRNLWTHEWHKN